jgi:UDP-N-acetylmuramate: L-alanyl-gamma-D-glutamyl-meso-diaminopimelate ligase
MHGQINTFAYIFAVYNQGLMTEKQKIHLIAIGGSVMHNLAIDLHSKGHIISGSDDEIFEPSKSKLAKYGLLPEADGWFPEKITQDLEVVIVGMHARSDNPELMQARHLGLKVYSFPEYIYQHSQDKQRIVIAGSHGKTTITSMIMHVLKVNHRLFDYLVGAELEGFDKMLQLSEDAPIIILEGDEYLSAPFDPTPKLLHYHHHIGVISGIAWDHVNVFPTIDEYVDVFEQFADNTPKAGTLIMSQDDSIASVIANKDRPDVNNTLYQAHPYKVMDGTTYLITPTGDKVSVHLFGEHNMKNISAAKAVCHRIGITDNDFYKAISSFKGAAKRLEKITDSSDFVLFKDFAHAPSKVQATTTAVKQHFIDKKLVACLELHTYSSLNKEFLEQYKDALNAVDIALIYYNPHSFELKKLEVLTKEAIHQTIHHDHLIVFDDIEAMKSHLLQLNWHNKILLMMSSGNFANLNLKALGTQIEQTL